MTPNPLDLARSPLGISASGQCVLANEELAQNLHATST